MKIFKLKTIPAPWNGPKAEVTVVDLEDALRRFPHPNEDKGFVDSDGVFIGAKVHNMPTYVMIETEDREHAWMHERKLVMLWSVNGGGERRWVVDPKGCSNKADLQAIEGFGLSPAHVNRSISDNGRLEAWRSE